MALVTAIRWATTAIALLLLSTREQNGADAVFGAALVSYALWRTVRPIDLSTGNRGAVGPVVAEGALVVTGIAATGSWDSAYVFSLVTVVCAAGFAGGFALAVSAGAVSLVAIAVPYHLVEPRAEVDLTLQWGGELALISILAGYVRRLLLQASAASSTYAGRLHQLSEMNHLLLKLRRVAQNMPTSLDLAETVESSASRLQELFRPDLLVILLRDGEVWTVAKAVGTSLSRQLTTADLPPVLRQAAEAVPPVLAVPQDYGVAVTLDPQSESGLYARLSARQEVIGLVVVERRSPHGFGAPDITLMGELCQQMAIAVDNARWFSQIGTLAAEQERSRIARDLHDRVGQSLALVGFELDRMSKKSPDPRATADLLDLREHVRAVVGELRETLYDLRTDVSEERTIEAALADFLDRVRERSGLTIEMEHRAPHRLPLTVEREVWRIAQEAVFNAERHARAGSVRVTWIIDDAGAELCVADDGEGMPPTMLAAARGYGLLGMQERSRAIGGELSFESSPAGTTVRLTLQP